MKAPNQISLQVKGTDDPVGAPTALPASVPLPHGPLHLLFGIASHPDREIQSAVLAFMKLTEPPTSVEGLAAAVRRIVEEHPAGYNLVRWEAAHSDGMASGVMRALAQFETTPAALLEEMASKAVLEAVPSSVKDTSSLGRVGGLAGRDLFYRVREAVADNPRTPPPALLELAGDDDPWVRSSAASNPNTPVEALVRLAGDEEVLIRIAVARSPRVAHDHRLALAVQLSVQYPGDPDGLEEAVDAVLG